MTNIILKDIEKGAYRHTTSDLHKKVNHDKKDKKDNTKNHKEKR